MTAGAFDRVWSGEPVRPVLLGVERRVQTLLDLAAERRRQRGGVARRGPGGANAEVRA
jgi:hypothetical protein